MFYYIFREMNKKGIIDDKKIFVIYPTLDNKIYLRCLNDDNREYFSQKYLSEYISFTNEVIVVD